MSWKIRKKIELIFSNYILSFEKGMKIIMKLKKAEKEEKKEKEQKSEEIEKDIDNKD